MKSHSLFPAGRLSALEIQVNGSIAKLELRQTAINPTDPQSIKDAENVLETARKRKVKLPVEVITEAGTKFVEVADKQPTAWPVTQEFLSYRSFLNADFVPSLKDLTPLTDRDLDYRISVTINPNPQHPEFHKAGEVLFAGGRTTPDKSARLERLDGIPQPKGSGLAFFVVNGGLDTIVLDGEYMKTVIIRNADVAYSGGPTILENVYFVNCTFTSFQSTPNGRQLSKTLLASASTTFKTDQTLAWLGNPHRSLRRAVRCSCAV